LKKVDLRIHKFSTRNLTKVDQAEKLGKGVEATRMREFACPKKDKDCPEGQEGGWEKEDWDGAEESQER